MSLRGHEAGKPDVSVVVPVYKNAGTLRELHHRLRSTLDGQNVAWEIVFVNDACPGGSLEVLERMALEDARVVVLSFERNRGQHRAVTEGLAAARGSWTVVMDADLQDPPEALPSLLQKGAEGFSAVFGGRRGQYESDARLLTSKLFKRVLRLLTGLPKDAGIFVAMNRAMRERLVKMDRGFPSVVAMIGCAGMPVASVAVERSLRPLGDSAYSSWGRLKSAWRAIAWVLAFRAREFRNRR